jgi:hypothetical protein
MPSIEEVILPSRAILRSWRDQTIPARKAALAEAVELYEQVDGSGDRGLRDMALLGVVADAMQPLEDLAYLATAWDDPFAGLAYYVRATTYSERIPTNFWQGVRKWHDDRLDVLAGFSMREPNSSVIKDSIEVIGFDRGLESDALAVMEKARIASRERLRAWLRSLSDDWVQFAPYFLAFKHGGLALNREDTAFVSDEVESITDETDRFDPSLAVWRRRGDGSEVFADHNLTPKEVMSYVQGTGHLAIDTIEGFLASRLAVLEAVTIGSDGKVAGLNELQLPWTIWLAADDLTDDEWSRLGAGPRIRWASSESGSLRRERE